MTDTTFTISEHTLVPKHEKVTDAEKTTLLTQYNISAKQLPQMKQSDPAIKHLNPALGDIIKITRASATIGETAFYRVVVYG